MTTSKIATVKVTVVSNSRQLDTPFSQLRLGRVAGWMNANNIQKNLAEITDVGVLSTKRFWCREYKRTKKQTNKPCC